MANSSVSVWASFFVVEVDYCLSPETSVPQLGPAVAATVEPDVNLLAKSQQESRYSSWGSPGGDEGLGRRD